MAIYAAQGSLKGPAIGPFPARIESLETEAAFRAKTTADDPDAATVVYISDVPLEKPGEWVFAAMTKQGDGSAAAWSRPPARSASSTRRTQATRLPSPTPTWPPTTPTSAIDTRVPPSSMHDDNLADVLGKKPVVLLFATPRSARAASADRSSTSPSR